MTRRSICHSAIGKEDVSPHSRSMEEGMAPMLIPSYLYGTIDFGVRLQKREKGRSVLDPEEDVEVDPDDFHLLEVVTDSDDAGSREDRKPHPHSRSTSTAI